MRKLDKLVQVNGRVEVSTKDLADAIERIGVSAEEATEGLEDLIKATEIITKKTVLGQK